MIVFVSICLFVIISVCYLVIMQERRYISAIRQNPGCPTYYTIHL